MPGKATKIPPRVLRDCGITKKGAVIASEAWGRIVPLFRHAKTAADTRDICLLVTRLVSSAAAEEIRRLGVGT